MGRHAAGAGGVGVHVLHLHQLHLREVEGRKGVVADGVERPEGTVIPAEAAQERLADGKAAQVRHARQDARVGRVAVGEVRLPPLAEDAVVLPGRHGDAGDGTHGRHSPFVAVDDEAVGEDHAAEGREAGDRVSRAGEVPAGRARERLHRAAVVGEVVRLAGAALDDGRGYEAGEVEQDVRAVEGLAVGVVQLELGEPVEAGGGGGVRNDGRGIAGRVARHGYLEGRPAVPQLLHDGLIRGGGQSDARVADVRQRGEEAVALLHLGGIREGEAVRQDLHAHVELIAGIDALDGVAAPVVAAVLVREGTLAAVAQLVEPAVGEDGVLADLLRAVDAGGHVDDVRVGAVEGGAGDYLHGLRRAVAEEHKAVDLAVVDEVAHRGLGGREQVRKAGAGVAVLRSDERQRPPRVVVRGIVGSEERGVQRDGVAAVVARVADRGEERPDAHHGPLEIPAQVAHLPLGVRVRERQQGAGRARLVGVDYRIVIGVGDGFVDVLIGGMAGEAVLGVEVLRDAVVARRKVHDVPPLVRGRPSGEVVPRVLHGVGCDRHDVEVRHILPVDVLPDHPLEGALRAVLGGVQRVEERAETAEEGDGVGVDAVVGVHRVEAAVAGLQDGAVVAVDDEGRLARRVELRAVVADAEDGAAVQAEGRAEDGVVPAGAGELYLVAGGVDHRRGVGRVLAGPVVEDERIVAEVHRAPGDIELRAPSHRLTLSAASATPTV